LSAIKTGGSKWVVFAGGDPSLRGDIVELIDFARHLGLKTEVQTNCNHVTQRFLDALLSVDLVGLSLDGPNAEVHDDFRSMPGNHEKVLRILGELRQKNVPAIVRTIVSKPNYESITQMIGTIDEFPNVVRWSLLEFSPIGDGYANRRSYELERPVFDEVVKRVAARYSGSARLDVYRSEDKTGTYALVTSGGNLYGTVNSPNDGAYPIVGSMIHEHLSTLADRLPFSKDNHFNRYGMDIVRAEMQN